MIRSGKTHEENKDSYKHVDTEQLMFVLQTEQSLSLEQLQF